MSPDRVRLAGEMMSSNVLYKTIDGADPADSDRWTALLAEELDKVMGSLTDHMLALTGDEPEIRNRYDAIAKAVSDAGGHYSETQAKKFSDTLRVEASSAAIAECEGLLNLCEHERSQADPSATDSLDRMAGYVRARLIALRIGQASSSEG